MTHTNPRRPLFLMHRSIAGGAQAGPIRLSFNPHLRVEYRGATSRRIGREVKGLNLRQQRDPVVLKAPVAQQIIRRWHTPSRPCRSRPRARLRRRTPGPPARTASDNRAQAGRGQTSEKDSAPDAMSPQLEALVYYPQCLERSSI